jgi:hypothetical protein
MKKTIAILSFILIFTIGGCAYNGYLQQGFHEPSKPLKSKIDLSAAVVNTQELKDYRLQEHTGGVAYTFYINPAFNEELIKELSGVFSNVQLINTSREMDKFDIQIIPSVNYEYISGTAWDAAYKYKFTMIWIIKDKFNNIVDEFKNTDDLVITPGAAEYILSVITGLSLFILSPITIPLAIQIGGHNATGVIGEATSRSFKVLSYQVANSPKIYNYRPRQEAVKPTPPLANSPAPVVAPTTSAPEPTEKTVNQQNKYPKIKGIILNNEKSKTIYGEILNMNAEKIEIKTKDGEIKVFRIDDVYKFININE